ncbi:MAG: 2-amino-4-hydroxy-6-hydroxymethyldihydropteridine diphosphokinase [Pseudomonadota bacterium]
MVKLHPAVIALGSNIGGSSLILQGRLVRGLRHLPTFGIRLVSLSEPYQTPAFPPGAGGVFVNAAALVAFSGPVGGLLAALHRIEAGQGRVRRTRWSARTLDLDVIDAGGVILPNRQVLRSWMELPLDAQRTRVPDRLLLPHPRAHERSFVIRPLLDVAPGWQHPVLGRSGRALLRDCPAADRNSVLRLAPVQGWRALQAQAKEQRARSKDLQFVHRLVR